MCVMGVVVVVSSRFYVCDGSGGVGGGGGGGVCVCLCLCPWSGWFLLQSPDIYQLCDWGRAVMWRNVGVRKLA